MVGLKTILYKIRLFKCKLECVLILVCISGLLVCSFSCVSGSMAGRGAKTYENPEWKYIVIHHSATAEGNASVFEKYHYQRGMKYGLAYHFVIDNGTYGKRDGQLEIGSRWKKQLGGGHSRQQWVNNTGIGICLVGNFNKTRPTRKQMRTLVKLVNELQDQYNISNRNVVGHGQIKGEKTQCPGKYFPWKDFNTQLES